MAFVFLVCRDIRKKQHIKLAVWFGSSRISPSSMLDVFRKPECFGNCNYANV